MRNKAIEEMLGTAWQRGFEAEIFLFSQLMNTKGAQRLRGVLEQKGLAPPFTFHLPDVGYDLTDFLIGLDCLGHRDVIGAATYMPTRGLIYPLSQGKFHRLMNQFKEVFPPEEGHLLTIHTEAIFRLGTFPPILNRAGEQLAGLAKRGYKIGVEFVFEGGNSPVACQTPGHLDSLFKACKDSGFGLTIDLYDVYAMIARSGCPFEEFPKFLKKLVGLVKSAEVPIYMIHFNPFDLSSRSPHLAPSDSIVSYPWMKRFFDDLGLEDVPISLEMTSNFFPKLNGNGFSQTQEQRLIEELLRSQMPARQ